jgi:uncharacterized protein RhaS with RHS repeats
MVTDETGTPLTSVTYYPFGRTNECTGSSQSYLFIGKEEDATGLYYFNQRYYDPETGRFITEIRIRGYLMIFALLAIQGT